MEMVASIVNASIFTDGNYILDLCVLFSILLTYSYYTTRQGRSHTTHQGRSHRVSTAPYHETSIDRNERQELVNNALVVKHVIKKPKEENDVGKTGKDEESIEEQERGQIPENEDSKSTSWQRSTSKVEVDEAMSSKYRRKKSNLIISETDRGESICAICINEYKEQEEICWSHNPDCEHCFHHKCIEMWLAWHDECPCCRNSYLESGNVERALAQQGRDFLENNSISSRYISRGDWAWYDIALDYSGAVRDEGNSQINHDEV
jgi:hypothetical protein